MKITYVDPDFGVWQVDADKVKFHGEYILCRGLESDRLNPIKISWLISIKEDKC